MRCAEWSAIQPVAPVARNPAKPPARNTNFMGKVEKGQESVSVRRASAPGTSSSKVAGSRRTGGKEERLEGVVEKVVPELAPLRHLIEVGKDKVRGAEITAGGMGVAERGAVVGGVEDEHALGDLLAVEPVGDRLVVRGATGRDGGQIEVDETTGDGGFGFAREMGRTGRRALR